MMKKTLLCAIAILASGCAGSDIYVQSQTPATITLQYDELLAHPQNAANVAQNHCASSGKNARLTHSNQSSGWAIVTYDCVAP